MPSLARLVRSAVAPAALGSLLACAASVTGCDHPDRVKVIEVDAGAHPVASAAPGANARAWPVVVSIVIDQEAAWIADERWPLLPADGGFARLRREGTYAKDMRYAQATTDTAPGHAALYTGAPPRVSGVWGNEVIDPASFEKVSILRDPATKLVSPGLAAVVVGDSMGPLKVDTVADRLRVARPDAFIVSLSLKDRGAIFGGGRASTAILWYDKGLDRFVTSNVLGSGFPAWAAPLAVPSEVRKDPWVPLDAAWVKSHAATPDDAPGEGELGGMSAVFPHDVAHAKSVPAAFRGSPFADDAVLGLALASLSAERAGERPTLLALSLSANDYIGHAFGPDSWEAWDELRRLDASLARFFAQLDERFGPAGWFALLSADHGATTMPEATAVAATRPWCARANGKERTASATDAGSGAADRWGRACGKVGRLMPDELSRELRNVAAKTVTLAATGTDAGPDPIVLGVADPYVFLTAAARSLPADDLARLEKALSAALLRHPEVDRVIDTSTLPETCPAETDDSIDALVCRSFVPGKAGDLYILARRGSFFDPGTVPGKGSSHGSPYPFDRSVPLLVRAPGHVPAGRVIEEPISFRAFSRTLATLLGIEPPNFEAAHALDLARKP